jgi:hypothetical protein
MQTLWPSPEAKTTIATTIGAVCNSNFPTPISNIIISYLPDIGILKPLFMLIRELDFGIFSQVGLYNVRGYDSEDVLKILNKTSKDTLRDIFSILNDTNLTSLSVDNIVIEVYLDDKKHNDMSIYSKAGVTFSQLTTYIGAIYNTINNKSPIDGYFTFILPEIIKVKINSGGELDESSIILPINFTTDYDDV